MCIRDSSEPEVRGKLFGVIVIERRRCFDAETIIERERDLGYVSNSIHDGMVSFRDATKSEGERICDGEFERLEIRVRREGGGRGEEVEIVVVVVV